MDAWLPQKKKKRNTYTLASCTSAHRVSERERERVSNEKERCDKQQEGQRVKEDISWKQTASFSRFYFPSLAKVFSFIFFSPGFSQVLLPPSSDCLIALLCCPGTQTLRRLSRSSSIGDLRKTLTHPATQLSRNNITRRRRRLPWAITRNPFILHDALMLRLPTWLTLGRGHARLETMARA